ncbi:hypothetical protein DICPUDRAFT_88972 [Dictyostelium purpureum]|uniref:alpha-1,3-mannosyl-glycoprotein 2-beta-N-acetylglucosaminyltransferase n=1 Tax=Dictyostelium purpureum TaxID=5786 RepID=F0ZSW2_DICPU|nr:uncharacterized protein DICPUDRAFT_88972 [Dictyostelium purpureum]EGC32979.1 hypothetical protein DICPUDRAFT_88972 [Dictyostelium purpureum]|eukprot:XP_003290497.1 hypothetical protein DICPUDRAFT_88972 [Dictyostelium purpureum]
MFLRNNFKTIIIIVGLLIYLYLFIVGISSSKQIELLEYEKQNLNKENDKSTNTISKYLDQNKSLNQTIRSLQYTIDEFRKNFAKSEIQFDNELNLIKYQLDQYYSNSNTNMHKNRIFRKNFRIFNKVGIFTAFFIMVLNINKIKFRIRKDKLKFPIIVSQDCNSREMYSYLEKLSMGDEIITIRSPNRTKLLSNYEMISRHYKWFLTQIFDKFSYDKIIIVEDDLIVSPDFLDYFEKMSPLLDKDESLFCISAWNDNGKKRFINPNEDQAILTFHRTDFFPGLGWMMKNKFWKEIKSEWPDEYWDDYLRKKEVFKGRQCIRPELPRVKNIGENGATNSQVFGSYIKEITYNENITNVDYKSYNTNELLEPQYSNTLKNQIENAQIIQAWEIDVFNYVNKTLRIVFNSKGDYNTMAIQFKLIEDDRDEIQRTSFKKIVQFYHKSNLIFLTPKEIEW